MNLNSRKTVSYIVNTIIFTGYVMACMIWFNDLLKDIFTNFAYFQLVNTGLFLGANSVDKMTWVKANIPNGKQEMIEQQNGGGK